MPASGLLVPEPEKRYDDRVQRRGIDSSLQPRRINRGALSNAWCCRDRGTRNWSRQYKGLSTGNHCEHISEPGRGVPRSLFDFYDPVREEFPSLWERLVLMNQYKFSVAFGTFSVLGVLTCFSA